MQDVARTLAEHGFLPWLIRLMLIKRKEIGLSHLTRFVLTQLGWKEERDVEADVRGDPLTTYLIDLDKKDGEYLGAMRGYYNREG